MDTPESKIESPKPSRILGQAMKKTGATAPGIIASESTRALLWRLWCEHISRHRLRLAAIGMLTVIMAAATSLYPAVIDHAFSAFARKDPRILYQIPLVVLAITATKAAAQFGQTVLVQGLVLDIIRELQNRMFGHLVHADLARLERETPGQLSARFTTDAAVIRESLTRAVTGVADLLTVAGLIASMIYMDWLLSLITAALYPLAAVPIQRLGRRVRRASGSMQERMGAVTSILTESFAQARTVRAYRIEDVEIHRTEAAFLHLNQALLRMVRNRASVAPLLEMLAGLSIALVIGFAGWRAAMGVGTLGNFSGFVAALLIASRPLRALGSLNATLQEGLAGLARVFSVLNEPSAIADPPHARPLPAGPGQLEFENVYFEYPDGRRGLNGLSFTAAPGTTLALVGSSGAGKSTALALIPRLYEVTEGRILLDGTDVRDVQLDSLRAAIAYVGQDVLLFDDTIAANIRLGRRGATTEEIRAAAEAAAAAEFISLLPDGYETRVGTGGQRLSGGQRQRVMLARSFLHNPRILLLDEATSALDAESEAAIQRALQVLRKDRTTIIVAHRLSTVRDADVVVVMSEGRALEIGTHTALLAREGMYARLVQTQSLAQ